MVSDNHRQSVQPATLEMSKQLERFKHIRESPGIQSIDDFAARLPRKVAKRFYESLEAVSRILTAEAAFCAESVPHPPSQSPQLNSLDRVRAELDRRSYEFAQEHLETASSYGDYFALQVQRYTRPNDSS